MKVAMETAMAISQGLFGPAAEYGSASSAMLSAR
jgi:hypothetical protein